MNKVVEPGVWAPRRRRAVTAIFPEFEFTKNSFGANDESFGVQETTGEFPIPRPVSLTRVLKLRCTLRDRINRWAERCRSKMVQFEGNSHIAGMYYIRELGEASGAANAARHIDQAIEWGGGPRVRSAMVAQMMPHVVCESLKIDLDLTDAAEVMLTDVLHEVFEELFHDIETVRSGLIQKVHDAGGNLMALGAIVERVDALTIPEIPTEAEIARDLFLGYAYAQRMHIQGTRSNLERAGCFYRSQEVCDTSGIHAQGICSVLNRLPDVDLPGGRGDLLKNVEFHAVG